MWNPWKALTDLAHLHLHFSHGDDMPPNTLGLFNFDSNEITLRHGMSQAQRRSVLTHELVHHDRGPVPIHLTTREEKAVSREAARRLIPFDDLVRAMVWADNEHELADELWVDVPTAVARLEALTSEESRRLTERLLDAEPDTWQSSHQDTQ